MHGRLVFVNAFSLRQFYFKLLVSAAYSAVDSEIIAFKRICENGGVPCEYEKAEYAEKYDGKNRAGYFVRRKHKNDVSSEKQNQYRPYDGKNKFPHAACPTFLHMTYLRNTAYTTA